MSFKTSYNKRLLQSRFRRKIHTARFNWLTERVNTLGIPCDNVLELGCFDGKAIEYLNNPKRYVGYDANWEGGLTLGNEKWKDRPNTHFYEATEPHHLDVGFTEKYDLCICQETLEHIPPELIEPYLEKISQQLNGHFLVTVPNEKGLIFMTKFFANRLGGKKSKSYSFSEFVNASLGNMEKVERWQHKGFDHAALARQIGKYFDIEKIQGLPMKGVPVSLSFTIAITAKTKN